MFVEFRKKKFSLLYILIGPPGPTGIPSKNQMRVKAIQTIVSAIEYGIKLDSNVPSFIFLSYFERKKALKVSMAS